MIAAKLKVGDWVTPISRANSMRRWLHKIGIVTSAYEFDGPPYAEDLAPAWTVHFGEESVVVWEYDVMLYVGEDEE
jgi:hypothetical protein